jgi:hypothetical protein
VTTSVIGTFPVIVSGKLPITAPAGGPAWTAGS